MYLHISAQMVKSTNKFTKKNGKYSILWSKIVMDGIMGVNPGRINIKKGGRGVIFIYIVAAPALEGPTIVVNNLVTTGGVRGICH